MHDLKWEDKKSNVVNENTGFRGEIKKFAMGEEQGFIDNMCYSLGFFARGFAYKVKHFIPYNGLQGETSQKSNYELNVRNMRDIYNLGELKPDTDQSNMGLVSSDNIIWEKQIQ